MKIDREDFDEWLANPVTEEVLRGLRVLAERSKQRWIELSWGGGSADALMLADLRARSEVVNDLCELTFEELEEYLDDGKQERHRAD